MTLVDYLRVLRRRWRAVLVCAVLGLIVADVVAITSPKTYEAGSTSFVRMATSANDDSGSSVYSGAQFALAQVPSYTKLVSSPLVLEPVIKELDLDLTLAGLQKRVTATSPAESVLLNVTATASDPQVAARIANATAKQLGTVIEQVAAPEAAGRPLLTVTLTEPATAPDSPSSPRLKLYLALGLLAGLAIGVGYAVIRQQLDTSITSPDDLQAMTAVPPLGVIESGKKAAQGAPIVSDERSPSAEGYRAIRTNLQFVDIDNPPRVIVVTSAMPSEGKTSTACNLAIAFAQSGSRVCLVSADLRRPKLAEYLDVAHPVGLTEVLTGEHDVDDAVISWRKLSVLLGGTLPSDPSAVLASQAMAATVRELRQRFDVVIIDAPPLLSATDAAVVAHIADGALLVARHGKTTREQLRRAGDALRSADVRLLGTVLTFAPTKRHRLHSYATRSSVSQPTDTRQDRLT